MEAMWRQLILLSVLVVVKAGLTIDVARKSKTPQLPLDHPRLTREGNAPHTPEQISLSYAGPGAVVVQWVTWPQEDTLFWQPVGSKDALFANRKQLATPNYYLTRQTHSKDRSHCDKMLHSGLRSVVEWGTESGVYDHRIQRTAAVECYELGDYQSGALHHVVIGDEEGPLPANTTIYYRCGDPEQEWSPEYTFTSAPPVSPSSLPYRLGLLGDLGQTEHSLSTLEHLQAQDADSVLFAGDLSYADGYQPRWDSWGRMMGALTTRSVYMYTEGNHEQEHADDVDDFLSYTSRFKLPSEASRSTSPLYYSYDVAGMHIIMLGSYTDYDVDSDQYAWLIKDLASVDRSKTPWLIVSMHAPWYNSNDNHFGEAEDMRIAMEGLLYQHGVDAVISGHVHAFERSVPTYNNIPDECGPVYINIGDGGNYEGLAMPWRDPQPEWSALRESSYGHGVFDFYNTTHARFSWHRNQDEYSEMADEYWFVRGPDSPCASKRLAMFEDLIVKADSIEDQAEVNSDSDSDSDSSDEEDAQEYVTLAEEIVTVVEGLQQFYNTMMAAEP